MAHNFDTCTLCKVSKPVSQFTKDSKRPLGYRRNCLECHGRVQRERNKAKTESKKNQKTRECLGCLVELPITHFSSWRSFKCFNCKAETYRIGQLLRTQDPNFREKRYYKDARDKNFNRRTKRKERCIIFKGGKCQQCGLEYHPEKEPVSVFDFHHKDPEVKDTEIAKLLRRKIDKERIKTELEKCILLCSNCHRKLHWFQKRSEYGT